LGEGKKQNATMMGRITLGINSSAQKLGGGGQNKKKKVFSEGRNKILIQTSPTVRPWPHFWRVEEGVSQRWNECR